MRSMKENLPCRSCRASSSAFDGLVYDEFDWGAT